ncbi:MAG TPA: zinc ribbon domain-containing protein [Anaerolineae bacterium]|nr:zinc ribbon domain-containing protein [Anaerolineae bacterium]
MKLTAFECPNCGAKEMLPDPDDRLQCLYCGTSFGEVQRICLECGHYNEAGARHCGECSAPLIRDCPACGADNWVHAEHCTECGRNLDLIALMARRLQQTTQERLQQRGAAMVAIKEQEERASQARMAVFLEMERERQEELARAEALQAQRDRRHLLALGGVGLAILFVMVIAFVAWSIAGQGG